MWKVGRSLGRVEVKIKEHNGVTYKNFRSTEKSNGVGAVGDRKVVLTGYAKICLVQGSYKYPPEMQFSLFQHKSESPEFKKRNPTEWNCVEMNMPLQQGKDLIEALYFELFPKEVEK